MAPGSWGVWAVFSHFSGEDSGQTGEATGELRVARCSWSHHLSNVPGPVRQLAASRKEFAREGDCPGGKTRQIFSTFSLFLSVFAHTVDLVSDVGFWRSWYRWKACATLFLKVPGSQETELGLEKYGPANRGHQSVFGLSEGIFRRRFRLDRGKSWRSESSTLCLNMSSFQRTRARRLTCCEPGRLCAQARQRRQKSYENFSTALFRWPVFVCVVEVAPDIRFRRSWYCRKACATYFPKV